MEKVKLVIIDDNEKFSAVLSCYLPESKPYEVVALLTHDEALTANLLQYATIAIVAVRSTQAKTFETIRYLKEKYSLKVLGLPLHLKNSIVFKLKNMEVEGVLSKTSIDGTNLYEALEQIKAGGNYYNLVV